MAGGLSRRDLIELVGRLQRGEFEDEADVDAAIALLQRSVPHPAVTDLIFYREMTPEQVVEEALRYQPFAL